MKYLVRGKDLSEGELNKIIREKTEIIANSNPLRLTDNQKTVLEAMLRKAIIQTAKDVDNLAKDENSDTIKLRRLKEIEREMKALEEEKLNLLHDY